MLKECGDVDMYVCTYVVGRGRGQGRRARQHSIQILNWGYNGPPAGILSNCWEKNVRVTPGLKECQGSKAAL